MTMERTKNLERPAGLAGLSDQELDFLWGVEREIERNFGSQMLGFAVVIEKHSAAMKMRREGKDKRHVAFMLVTGKPPH